MDELIFLVEDVPEGGYTARAVGELIFTEADTIADLHEQVRDAVRCHFDPDQAPKIVRLRFVRDVVIPLMILACRVPALRSRVR